MINAIVVDDEKLVRKGFISLIDWQSYGIEITGEAANGSRALQLLEQQRIDLMFVDITMPGMTGFELLQQVQQSYGTVQFVILTCHHEFDYVQEALRRGAIDYIVKTLLNKDNVDETMKRIQGRLQREASRVFPAAGAAAGTIRGQLQFSGAVVFRSRGSQGMSELRALLPEGAPLLPLSTHLYICHQGNTGPHWRADELAMGLHSGWEAVLITGGEGQTRQEAERTIRQRLEHWLFYAGPTPPAVVSLDELVSLHCEADDPLGQERLLAEWQQFRWLLHGKEWAEWSDTIVKLRPSPAWLSGLVQGLCLNWAHYMAWSAEEQARLLEVARPQGLWSWSELERLLSEVALVMQRRLADLSLSREVALCLIRALHIMRQQACDNLTQNEVAHVVSMSRSYFSQCFKQLVGYSFGEVLRRMRIDQAKRLLQESSLSVYEISGAVGFYDNKHFSRTFKERVGMYPKEYRNRHQAGKVEGE